jgi:hypothetical protein
LPKSQNKTSLSFPPINSKFKKSKSMIGKKFTLPTTHQLMKSRTTQKRLNLFEGISPYCKTTSKSKTPKIKKARSKNHKGKKSKKKPSKKITQFECNGGPSFHNQVRPKIGSLSRILKKREIGTINSFREAKEQSFHKAAKTSIDGTAIGSRRVSKAIKAPKSMRDYKRMLTVSRSKEKIQRKMSYLTNGYFKKNKNFPKKNFDKIVIENSSVDATEVGAFSKALERKKREAVSNSMKSKSFMVKGAYYPKKQAKTPIKERTSKFAKVKYLHNMPESPITSNFKTKSILIPESKNAQFKRNLKLKSRSQSPVIHRLKGLEQSLNGKCKKFKKVKEKIENKRKKMGIFFEQSKTKELKEKQNQSMNMNRKFLTKIEDFYSSSRFETFSRRSSSCSNKVNTPLSFRKMDTESKENFNFLEENLIAISNGARKPYVYGKHRSLMKLLDGSKPGQPVYQNYSCIGNSTSSKSR